MRSGVCNSIGALLAIGLFIEAAPGQDILTPAVTGDLLRECHDNSSTFSFCVTALKQHGQGKDDVALETLGTAAGETARIHYQMAQSRLGDKFWKLVARVGAAEIGCDGGLAATLHRHFELKPEALGTADDDYSKNNFIALADLLGSIPDDGFPATAARGVQTRIQVADVYRYCFSDPDHMFGLLRHELGR
jgi:hypothetical protein